MHAVILTGGKQYRVKEGDVLAVEKLDIPQGRKVLIDQVLLIEDGDTILVGTPVIENALVRADVLETFKDEKVLVFKKKRRKQFRRTRGHRQQLTRIRIDRIFADKTAVPAEELREAAPLPVEVKIPAAEAKPKVAEKTEAEAKKTTEKAKPTKKSAPAKEAKAKAAPRKPAAPKTKKATKE
jgi:large subunit ribosomal protein L21